VSTLSVAIAQIASSAATSSPTAFSHSMIVPSSTETPMWGIGTTTVAMLALTRRPRPGP
jgi:hypothetical protein